LHYVHDATIRFQYAFHFAHPRNMLYRIIAEPRDSFRVSPIVSLGR
jgi:hypothetical protein